MSATAFFGLLQELPGFWGSALAALALIFSAASVVWVSVLRARVLLARVEAERATRMFELETARQEMLLQAQFQLEAFRGERRQSEIEFPLKRKAERAQIPAPETKAA